MQEHTIRSYYQLVADNAAQVWSTRNGDEEKWEAANDQLSYVVYGDDKTFAGLGQHRQDRDHANMAYAMRNWAEFVRSKARLDRRSKAAQDGREFQYRDYEGLVPGGKGLSIREWTDTDGSRMREIYKGNGDLKLLENISHDLEVQRGDAVFDPSGGVISGDLHWGGLYSDERQHAGRWSYDKQKGDEDYDSGDLRRFLQRTGIEWGEDTASPFKENGEMSPKVYLKDTGLVQDAKDIAKTLIGKDDAAGFSMRPEIADLPMFSNDPKVIERDQILSGQLHEDELGRKYVTGPDGDPRYIPSLGSGKYTFTGEDGKSHTIDMDKADLQDIRDMHEGDILQHTFVGNLYHSKVWGLLGETDFVDTVYGEMLLPKITGNRDIDEQLMNDPLFLRAALEERSSWGWKAFKSFARMGISLVEFQSFGPAWKVLGKAGKSVGGRIAARSEFGGMAREFAGNTLKRAAKVAEGGSTASQPIRKLRFTPSQIGEEMAYEVMTSWAAGDFDSFSEDVASGLKEGVLEMVFAGPIRAVRRGMSRIPRHLNEGAAKKLAARVAGPGRAGIARDVLEQRLFNPEFGQHVANAFDSGGTMWTYGVFAAAEEIAAREGKQLMDLDADELREAATSAEAFGMMMTGLGVNLGQVRKMRGLPYDPRQRRAMNDHIEAMARSVEGVDPEELRSSLGELEKLGLEDVARLIQEQFPDKEVIHEGYVPPTALEQIELLWEEEGGPEAALELIQSVETGVLEQLELEARGLPLEPGPDGTSPRAGLGKAVVDAVVAEQERREWGGDKKKRTRPKKKPRKASELPESELGKYTQTEGDAVSVRGMSVVPEAEGEGEGFRIVTRADHSKPVKRDAGPYDTREAAVRQMLEMSQIFEGDARSRKKPKRPAKHEQAILDPGKVETEPEASPEIEDVADVLEEMARLQAEERRNSEREALGRKPDPVGVPVPEPASTIQAQLEAVQDDRKPAMLVTPGSPEPDLPAGMTKREIPEGTLIHKTGNEPPAELGEALGYGTDSQEGEEVVTARDAEGRVVHDVQSAPTEEVLDAAAEVAGPDGSVEVRSVDQALAERRGEPSSEEVAQGLDEIVRNMKRTPEYGGKQDQEILDELISAETLATSEALQNAVEASRKAAESKGVTPSTVEPRGGDQASTRRELEFELGQMEPALAEDAAALHEAVPVSEPGESEEPGLEPREDLDAFARGFEAFRNQGGRGDHGKYIEVIQSGIWLRAQVAQGVEGAQAELDSMIAGMVMGTGGRRSAEGFVAALAGVDAGAVASIRARLLSSARNYSHRIDDVVDTGLIGANQLTSKRWGRETRELLLLATLPYGDPDSNRRSVGGYPKGSLITDIRGWAKGEHAPEGGWSMEALSEASGIEAGELPGIINAQANAVRDGLKGVTQKSQLRDVRAEVAARIASHVGLTRTVKDKKTGEPKVIRTTSMDAKLPNGKTLREATDSVMETLQGRQVSGDRGAPSATVEVSDKDVAYVQPNTQPVDAGEQAALLHSHTQSMRVAWTLLGRVTLPNGRKLVPSGVEGASTLGRIYLRQIELNDPAIREAFRNSMTDGRPTFSDPDAAFDTARERVAESIGYMERLALRHLGHEGGEATHRIVDAVFQALRQRAKGEAVSEDVLKTLREGDPLLFAPGEATSRTSDGIEYMTPGIEPQIARKLHDILNSDLEGLLVDMDAAVTDYYFANPINILFGDANWLHTDEARQTYSGWHPNPKLSGPPSIQSVFRGNIDSRKWVDWLDSKLPLGLGHASWKKVLAPVRLTIKGIGYLQAPVRGIGQPRSVRKAGLSTRESRLSSEYANDVFGSQAKIIINEINAKDLTLGEREFIGKAILSGAYQKIGSLDEWKATFGDGAEHLYGIGADIVALFNTLGRSLYEAGVLDREQFEKWAGRYLPRMSLDGFGGDYGGRLQQSHDLYWGGWNGRGFEKKADGEIDPSQQAFDVAFLLPYGVAAESNRLRLFDQLDKMQKRGDVFLKGTEWMALPPIAKSQWLPALERPGQKWPRPSQRKLAKFIQAEREAAEMSGFPMTERKAELLDAIEDGYVTTHTLGELEILLDQTDPSETGWLGSMFREMDVYWKRNNTLGSPRHWVLDSISSVLTNSMVGRVPMSDFIRSFATGKGYYADGGRGLKYWDDWNRSGRGSLYGNPNAKMIMLVDKLVEFQGGSTLQSQLFSGNEARDLFDAMTVGGKLTTTGTTANMFEAVTQTIGGSATARATLQSRIDKLSSAIDVESRALAIQELVNQYQSLQMWPRVAAALRGMDRGMSLREAAFWGSEGTGDYADRSPWLYRMTTQFSAPMTQRTREMISEEPSWVKRQAMRMPRWARTWWGTPFLMYRAAMIPGLSRAMLTNTLGASSGLAAVLLATRMMSNEDDERDLLFADPRIDKKVMERYLANHKEGFKIPWFGDLYTKASNLKLYLDAAADSALYIFTAGKRGEYRPAEAGMLTRAAMGSDTGRSKYLEMGEYVGGNLPGLAGKGVDLVADLMGVNGEKPIFTDPAEAYQMQGIGLLPTMGLAALSEVGGTILASIGGEKGRSMRGDWPVKRLISMGLGAMAEIGSPIMGVNPMLSSDGQRLILAALADGRSVGEYLDAMPRPALERMSVGEKVQSFASTFLLPTRSVRTTSLIPQRQSILEQRIKTLGRIMQFEMVGDDDDKVSERWDIASQGLRRFLTSSVKDAYVEAREGPMSVPADAVFYSYWMGLADDLIGPYGDKVLRARPASVLGKFIAGQPKDQHDAYITLATEFMKTTSIDLSRIFMPLVRQGEASPEFVSALTEGIYNQSANLDPAALLKKVASARDRWDDLNAEDRMRWFNVFRMMHVTPEDYGDPKHQAIARGLHQHFESYFNMSRGEQTQVLKDIGPMGAEMFAPSAAAEFMELLGGE